MNKPERSKLSFVAKTREKANLFYVSLKHCYMYWHPGTRVYVVTTVRLGKEYELITSK